MAFDEAVAERIREALAGSPDVVEKGMFGGIAFMVRGNMCCGVIGDRLMLRVGPKGYDTALSRPHAKPMDFTGRPMKGMVYIEPAGVASPRDLKAGVGREGDVVLCYLRAGNRANRRQRRAPLPAEGREVVFPHQVGQPLPDRVQILRRLDVPGVPGEERRIDGGKVEKIPVLLLR